MNKFYVFLGEIYYPLGGYKDFKGEFDSLDDAVKYIRINYSNAFDRWCHVVKDNKIVLEGKARDTLYSIPFFGDWRFKKNEH